ncbi:MAG: peptide chain release factor N(5)-glutamine methyltransferase [Clostridia bacterium]|nr:peptide chain release factor N(5)-glutamine methyltransferase [Clostridia bacterium]
MTMTLSQVYRKIETLLNENGVPDADIDALCLMEHFFGADRTKLILHGNENADENSYQKLFSAAEKRMQGVPLQYIIGKWNFMGYDFYVGQGVLIPRDDTEIAAEEACEFALSIDRPKIIDLCSGSGAIAITVAKTAVNSEVTALEYSENALNYLKKNIELNHAYNVVPFAGDVTKCADSFKDGSFDLIVSNPPYIRSEQIDTLQRELQFEPRMALDGGKDGLFFYRVITDMWYKKLKSGGKLLYEVGEDQCDDVCKILEKYGFENISFRHDLHGYKRTVSGTFFKVES